MPRRAEVLLVVGGGGVLGSALLARALACGRFGRVQALVAKDMASALRGFEPVPASCTGRPHARRHRGHRLRARAPQQRPRRSLRAAAAEQLATLATQLRAGGVRRLLVLVPHAPALLPQALKAGLATLDEGRVAALGFEQLLFVRAAQAGLGSAAPGWAQRLAAGWLSQLAWMVPQREQPVRAQRLAELAVELAWRLPQAAPATRVLPPELLWQAAHAADGGALLSAWLAGDAAAAARRARAALVTGEIRCAGWRRSGRIRQG